jgi:hypothetical protein
MSICSKWLALVAGCVIAAWAQAPRNAFQPAASLKIDFPRDSPVTLLSANLGESRTDASGGALVLDLHTALTLRNASQRHIRGVMLLVETQEMAPGGKASVAVPSLDVQPGGTFPVHIDLRLLRPLMTGGGPMAQVSLDGVLFEDLSFYGPDRLGSRRAMTVWELEARLDRSHLKTVFQTKGWAGLQAEMIETMARLADRPQLDVQVVRRGRSVAMTVSGRECQFAFLQVPGAPLETLSGLAHIVGSEASSPAIQVLNRSERPIRYFEIAWIIRDRAGREFMAGSVPAADSGLRLAPGAKSEVHEDAWLRFTLANGQPVEIASITGFVSQVEFSDGSIWIPNPANTGGQRLRAVLAPSPEQQRLAGLYKKRGLAALVEEVKNF